MRILQKLLALAAGVAVSLSMSIAAAQAQDGLNEAMRIVDDAAYTLEEMTAHPGHGPAIRAHMEQARAVLIVPRMVKGAFFVGGEMGRGVLLARAPNGAWSYPAFVNVSTASFGLQFGAQSSDLMLVVLTGRGLTSLFEDGIRLGSRIAAAAGAVGEGLSAETTLRSGADILSWSLGQGAFLGLSVEGARMWSASELDSAYYGAGGVTAPQIILEGQYQNTHADRLRDLLAAFPRQW